MPFVKTNSPNFTGSRGWEGKFFHTENMSFMHYNVAEDAASIPIHQHPNEEVWNIVEGAFEVTIDDETKIMGPGDVAVVPSNARHALAPKGAGKAIVVNYPHRLES